MMGHRIIFSLGPPLIPVVMSAAAASTVMTRHRVNHFDGTDLTRSLRDTYGDATGMITRPMGSSLPAPTFSSTVTTRGSSNGSLTTNMNSSFHAGFADPCGCPGRVLLIWLPI